MTEKARIYSTLSPAEKTATIIQWLDERKAHDILALDIADKNSLTDMAIVVSAASVRQAQSLADSLLDLCKEQNFEFLHLEGHAAGQWILVDMNDVVVHIFQPPMRELYNLEGLWRDAVIAHDGRREPRALVFDHHDEPAAEDFDN